MNEAAVEGGWRLQTKKTRNCVNLERLVLRMLRSKMERRQAQSSELPPGMRENGIELKDISLEGLQGQEECNRTGSRAPQAPKNFLSNS
jgi:hypothetical protein